MITVLFVDLENGARSQMAEAFMNKMGKGSFAAFSAGIRKGRASDIVREVMQDSGVNLSAFTPKEIIDFIRPEITFHYIITVCSEKELDQCPVFPAACTRLHWVFEDPSRFEGREKEIKDQYRRLRNLIR